MQTSLLENRLFVGSFKLKGAARGADLRDDHHFDHRLEVHVGILFAVRSRRLCVEVTSV